MTEEELRKAAVATWTPKDADHARTIIGRLGWEADVEEHVDCMFRACPVCMAALPKVQATLEIGCGMGRILRPFSTRFKRVVGVDINPEMLRLAREYLAECKNVELGLVDEAGRFPVASHSVDLVYSVITFQHMPTRAIVIGALAEAFRVLGSGGLLRVQTHIGTPPEPGQFRGIRGYEYPTAQAFADEIAGAGFEICSATEAAPWIWITARRKGGKHVKHGR